MAAKPKPSTNTARPARTPQPSTNTKPAPGSLTQRMRQANRWRDSYNPARGLTIARAVSLLESYSRGDFTDLMWTYAAPSTGIEVLDADYSALITRRLAAIRRMSWEVKLVEKSATGFNPAIAEAQAARLREVYEGIDNLTEAIEHLALATFRGFSLAEKWCNADGDIYHLELVDHWNIVRDGMRGGWKYNPDARSATFDALPVDPLPPEHFIIREATRPIGPMALLKFIRGNLGEKDWDGFLEIYGIPGGVVIMPPDVQPDREPEFEQAAKAVAEGGSGALPHGSDYKANAEPRGNNPFKERLDHLTEKLILAGTGGKLTMLAAPTGIGKGASEEQADVFTDIAAAEAVEISELFQRQLDAGILAAAFPDQPVLAYFELCHQQKTDSSSVVEDVSKLSAAGYTVDIAQVEEKTGYRLSVEAAPAPAKAKLGNRAPSQLFTLNSQLTIPSRWLSLAGDPLLEIADYVERGDLTIEEALTELEALANSLPDTLDAETVAAFALPLEQAMAAAVLRGVENKLANA